MTKTIRMICLLLVSTMALSQTPRRYPWGDWQAFGSEGRAELECRGRCEDWGRASGAGGFSGYAWDIQCRNLTSETEYEFDVGIDEHNAERLELYPGRSDTVGNVGGGRAVPCDREPNITISRVKTHNVK